MWSPCDDYNSKIRQEGGSVLPNGPRDSRTLTTPTGKGMLTVNRLVSIEQHAGVQGCARAAGARVAPAASRILGVYRVHVRVARPCRSARGGKFVKAGKVLR